jgi:hypothetical protein
MKVAFIEMQSFTRVREEYFAHDDPFREFQTALMDTPRLGPVIPGCSGVRKVRWIDPRRGKGKRGALRIIYVYYEELATIALLFVYDKDVASDLTETQRKEFAALAASVNADIRAMQGLKS